MNKKIIIIIVLVTMSILWGIILFVKFTSDEEKRLLNYLDKNDFINYENSYLYSKQISENDLDEYNRNVEQNSNSEYEMLYFNANNFQLTKDKLTYMDGITKNFTPTFDYKNDTLIYTYRINYNSTNVIIEGTFNANTDDFTCIPTYSYQFDIQNSKEDICNKIKIDVQNFQYEARTLIMEAKILEYMKISNN